MTEAPTEALTEALMVSNALLWVFVVVLGLVVLALTRQIGILHERIAPAGALAVDRGPKVGEASPELALETLAGDVTQLHTANSENTRTLLFFLSPTCPVCKTLLPTLRRIAREQTGEVRVLYASDGYANNGSSDEHEKFSAEHSLPREDYVVSQDLGLRFEVSKLPYAVLIDAAGIVRAKGLVNTREHLESLFEAERLEVGSLQEYAKQQGLLEAQVEAQLESQVEAQLELVKGGRAQ